MLKMGVRLAMAKKIAAVQTSANPLSTFAPNSAPEPHHSVGRGPHRPA
jgi:hypothetical protein